MAVDAERTERIPAVEGHEEDFTPSPAGWLARRLTFGAIVALVVVVTWIIPDFQADRLATAAIFGIVGLSMNMLLGYAGQISLGHQAFVGIGAFMSGLVTTELGLPFLVGLPAAMLTGAVSALILGAVALRVGGLYLALVTLTYGFVTERTVFLFEPFTGGGAGMPADRPPFAASDPAYAMICYSALALVLLFDWRFVKTKAGRAVQAVRDSEQVAASMGISVVSYKLLAFILSGMIAGLAGGLLAHRDTIVVAAPFNFQLALTFVLMTVVGGLRSRAGIVVGSAFFALLPNTIFELLKNIPGLSWLLDRLADPHLLILVLGPLLLIFTLVSFPGGIGQQLRPIVKWFAGERFSLHHMHEHEAALTGVAGGRP